MDKIIQVRDISVVDYFDKIITIHGKIAEIEPIEPKLIECAFRCIECGEKYLVSQNLSNELCKPDTTCSKCTIKTKRFVMMPLNESKFIDQQTILLEDAEKPNRQVTVIFQGMDLINKIPEKFSGANITGSLIIIPQGKQFRKLFVASDIEGELSPPIINNTEIGKSQRERLVILRGIVRDIQNEHKDGAPIEEILSRAEETGIKKETVEDMIQKLKSSGELIEASNERYRVV